MAKPEYYDLLGIPSEEEERTRTVLSAPADGGYNSYYQSFQQRRPQSMGGYGIPQRRIGIREYEQAQKKAAYEQNARRTLQQLTQIDPADPELTLKQEQLLMTNPYGQDLVRDPRVTSVLKNRFAERAQLEKQFSEDPDSQTDYLIARREGADHRSALSAAAQAAALRKERIWFAEKGGDLEDFDSGRFMRNGRFDKAAAAAHINQITKSQKDATKDKPWQERLSFKEGEAIRTAARAAKEGTFDDFEEEFAGQLANNPDLTRDAYVKQFKGDPDFNAYRQRRMLETGQTLMDEYGLSAQEAAQVLGIRPQVSQTPIDRSETAPAAPLLSEGNLDSARTVRGPEAMFEGVKPTSLAQIEGAPVAPAAPMAPADLKRIEPAVQAPMTFDTIQRQRSALEEDAKRKREEEFLGRQKQAEVASNQWETAKNEVLKGVTQEDLSLTARDFTAESTRDPYEILVRQGKNPAEVAFVDNAGRKVTWRNVLEGLLTDPRWKGETVQSTKDFSSLWGGGKKG